MPRTFNKEAYDLFDSKCKQEGIKVFHDVFGIDVIENPDKYGIDLVLRSLKLDNYNKFNGEYNSYCEVEIRNIWTEEEFPYNYVSIPYRKLKVFEKYLPFLSTQFFIVFNIDLTRCLIGRVSTILNKAKIKDHVSSLGNKEKFFRINRDIFLSLQKVNEIWCKSNKL